jgi:sugar lactone lactonase YvrE
VNSKNIDNSSYRIETIASGFAFPEGPRWHDNSLWFSDHHDGCVRRIDERGNLIEQFDVPGAPSGMGWLPDGDLLVVSMWERSLYRRRNGVLTPHADLSPWHSFQSNDMVVDAGGRAYVGNVGFDYSSGEAPRPTHMVLVDRDGNARLAAADLECPNGTVVSPDGRTLIVAESFGHRLTAFTIDSDGGLSGRRLFAALDGHVPDGICLDAEGCVWVASPYSHSVLRVRDGGEIVDRLTTEDTQPFACMFGGADRKTLFLCCAPHHAKEETLRLRGGRIDAVRVAIPGAGLP